METDGILAGAQDWMTAGKDMPFALPVVVAVFVSLSFIGFPQFGLFAVCAVVFGPVLGFVYSWVATMVGACLHFGLGKRFGNRMLERYGGERAQIFSRKVGHHGIAASAIVRLLPTAPFIVVNLAAGTSHMPFWKFALGTGLGILPKIAVVSFVGGSLTDLIAEQDPGDLAIVCAVVVAWIGAGVLFRRKFGHYFRRQRSVSPVDHAAERPSVD